MLKKIMKTINRQLLNLDAIKQAVESYKAKRQEQRNDQLFAKLLSEMEKDDTLGVVTLEEYRGGKVVSRESMILESRNWGGMKL